MFKLFSKSPAASRPAARDSLKTLADYFLALGRQGMLTLMGTCFPGEVPRLIESEWPVTQAAFDALSPDDVSRVEAGVEKRYGAGTRAELAAWKTKSIQHYRREILRYGCAVLPETVCRKTRMSSANPPAEVHSMMRQDPFAGDLYSGDMVVGALNRARRAIKAGGNYLDFGCSSAALLRNMRAAFPDARWHGCDPVATAIEWAGRQFADLKVFVSKQTPPLPFDDASLDGVYAISIWSHFSERAGLEWFDEMHRAIKQGGFLVMTTHGMRSLYFYLEKEMLPPDVIAGLLAGVVSRQFAFQAILGCDGLDMTDWGNAFFRPEWVLGRLCPKWNLLDFKPGLNQCNQDVYVLERGAGAVHPG